MARRFPFGDRNVQDDLRTTLMESHLLMQKTVLSAMVIFFKKGKAQGIPFLYPTLHCDRVPNTPSHYQRIEYLAIKERSALN